MIAIYMKKPTWISQIKFLCFDVDGTLYRNVPEVWNAIQAQIHQFVAMSKNWSISKTKEEFERRYRELGSSTKVLESFGLEAKKFFTDAFVNIDFRKYIKPDKRLFNLINRLKKKYTVGILSNGGMDSVTRKLLAVGLNPKQFFPFLTTYEFGALKPDPATFLAVIEKAGVKPEEAVYIGDREETDVEGAHSVGMRAILVWRKSEKADLSIPTIYDLEKYFL